MTTVALVAYPTLEERDRLWIESIRARHDPQALLISAHFTLVFPVELEVEMVAAHASSRLRDACSIPFVLRRAEAVPDTIGGGCHVFLVPQEGREALTALHDRLYEGVLRPHLREDVPFPPHVTVAGSRDVGECERLAEMLNRQGVDVKGTVSSIELIEVGHAGVKTLISVSFPRTNGSES
jgi:2'-5' RNA ligase